jgi:hypothetical protein
MALTSGIRIVASGARLVAGIGRRLARHSPGKYLNPFGV